MVYHNFFTGNNNLTELLSLSKVLTTLKKYNTQRKHYEPPNKLILRKMCFQLTEAATRGVL